MTEKTRNSESIKLVIHKNSGRQVESSEYFKREAEEARRLEITEDRVKTEFNTKASEYLCAYCKEPVQVYGSIIREKRKQRRHFRHAKGVISDCKYRYESKLTKDQIDLITYFGKRESFKHKRLKKIIKNNLEDTSYINNVEEEKWHINKSHVKYHTRRRPDLKFEFEGKEVVFEIQVSQLFLSVIIERTKYYKDNKLFLIWIFDDFDPEKEDNPFYQEDIFISQNRNIFIYDNECEKLSSISEELYIKCIYQIPEINYEKLGEIGNSHSIKYPIDNIWQEKYITLKEIIFDNENKVYYYNYTEERKKIINDAIQRESKRVFGFREYSKQYSFINKEWDFKQNLQSLIDRIKEGTRSILEYEKTEEFKKHQKGFERQRERIIKIEEEIDKRRISNNRKYRELQEEESEYIHKLGEQKRLREIPKKIKQERKRIAGRIREKKRSIEEVVITELEEENNKKRGVIEWDIMLGGHSVREIDKSIRNSIRKGKKLFKNCKREKQRRGEIKEAILRFPEKEKNTRREISEKYKGIRKTFREEAFKAIKGGSEITQTRNVLSGSLEARRFLNSFNEKTSLFERIKDSIANARANPFSQKS